MTKPISIQMHCDEHIAIGASCGYPDPDSGMPRLTVSSGGKDVAIFFHSEWQMSALMHELRVALKRGREAQVAAR